MAYIASQLFVMKDQGVYPGTSPSDLLCAYIPGVVLASGDGSIDLAPFIGHVEVVSYTMLKRATSTYSAGTNLITAANDAIGDTATVDILVFYIASKGS